MVQKTALIIGECYSDNVGDQAIADAMREALEDRGYFVRNMDYSCRGKKTQNVKKPITNNVLRILKHRMRWIVGIWWALKKHYIIREAALIHYDLVVVGGGQLILANSKFPIALYLWVNLLAKNNANINIISCGVGDSFSWIEKFWIKKALNLVSEIYLRDSRSFANAERNFGVAAKYCPDIVYYLSKNIPSKFNPNMTNIKGLSVIDYIIYIRYATEMSIAPLSEADYIKSWGKIIFDLMQAGLSVALLSTTEADHWYAEQVLSNVNDVYGYRVSIYPKPVSWKDFIVQVSLCNSLTTGRMHGLILAQISGIEPIPYLVNKKVEVFSSEYINKPVELIVANIDSVLDKVALKNNF